MLSLRNLSVSFRRYSGFLQQQDLPRLSQVSFDLAAGEVLAVVGASGAGKSLLAQALLHLLPANARQEGEIVFRGQALCAQTAAALRGRRIALVPQQISWLDPLATVGQQLAWAIRRTAGGADPGELLARYSLDPGVARLAPHQLSGGMARRVLLALAASGNPDLLIADEPTAGLDPENRAGVLALLRAHAQRGGAVLLITHDLAGALPFADRVALLREGHMCGIEAARHFQGEGAALRHPYARALWQALPQNGLKTDA